jgi:TolB-like protein
MSEPPATTPAEAAPAAPGFLRAIWQRVKAHKVVQWTLAYLAVAYTSLHGAEMLANSLSWPHSALRVFTLLLMLGLPVVVTRAWYHGARGRGRMSATEIMVIAILLALGGALIWRDTATRHAQEGAHAAAGTGSQGVAAPAASIAVLPFADLSPAGDQAYFSDGVAEEILNDLSHVSGLKVASRTSSFQFRNGDIGIPEIAGKLGVRHILEGSVRKAGDTVRITAQLIDAASDQHLWSQTFDRPLTTANLFGIQDEIATDIVQQLTRRIGSAGAAVGKPALPQAGTASLDVYELYLKGHALFLLRSRPNLSEAARLLRAAVTEDPKFARAWESLAAVLVVSQFWGLKEEGDYNEAALDAANRALALDPGLSLAHAVRGRAQLNRITLGGAGSWEQAIADLGEAIERDPQNATAFLWRGGGNYNLGYLERARADFQHCLQADPAYETCRRNLALVELCSGHTDQALRLYEAGLVRDYVNADVYFAPALAARGDRIGTVGILEQQYRAHPPLLEALFRALTDPAFSATDRQQAVALVDKLRDEQEAALGALWILRGYDQMAGLVTDTRVFWVRSEPEWLKSPARKRMLEQWRIPGYWRAHGFPPQCKPVGPADFACP